MCPCVSEVSLPVPMCVGRGGGADPTREGVPAPLLREPRQCRRLVHGGAGSPRAGAEPELCGTHRRRSLYRALWESASISVSGGWGGQ